MSTVGPLHTFYTLYLLARGLAPASRFVDGVPHVYITVCAVVLQANLRRSVAGKLLLFGVLFWSLWVAAIQV